MNRLVVAYLIVAFFWPVLCHGQNKQLADSLRIKGESFHDQGKYREAEFYYKEAFPIYQKHRDTGSMIVTGMYYAEVMFARSKYNDAINLLNSLLDIDHIARDTLRARMERTLGMIKENIGQLEESVAHFENALRLARESNDSLMIGYTLQSIADNYNGMGDHSKAINAYLNTIPILEAVGNRGGLSTAYRNIGSIYRELSLYDKALEYLNKSLEIRRELNNYDLLASSYNSIGGLQKDLGNYDQALIAYQKSLEYIDEVGSPADKANYLNNIGTLYNLIGNQNRALEYYEESLAIREKIDHPSRLTTLYSNIANRRFDLGDVQQAKKYYTTVLSIREEQGNATEIAKTLLDLAKVEQKKENLSQAHDYSRRAFAIADSTKDYSLLLDSSRRLGFIKREMDHSAEALSLFKNSFAYSRFLSKRHQIHPLMTLSEAYDKQNSDSTLVYGQEAIALIEESRSKTGSYSALKADFFERFSDFYVDMAGWELKYRNDVSKAYAYVERAKARTLADELTQASQRIDEALPDSVRIERNQKLSAIDNLYSQLRATENTGKREELESKIRKSELEYAAFQNELHSKYPEYKKLELQDPVTIHTARSINSSDTAILEYALSNEQLLVFFITRYGQSVHKYSLKELAENRDLELKELVQDFKDAILSQAGREELDLRSSTLYELLLEPFEEELSDYKNLLIIPDGPLAYLPFEALRNNNSYLIERFTIKYSPSVTSLTLLKDPVKEQKRDLLAVAGSEVMNVDSETGRRMISYSALPSTLIEIDSIASHFSRVTKLKEEEVTEPILKRHLNNRYQYIHLATHGYIDEDHPTQSGLRLIGTQNMEVSSENDGLLKSSEIYRLNLNSDMVVLSACNTGMGKVVKGEGMLGLQRSFFYAGTSTVVVSLWNVYDRSTASLMNEFYKSILDHQQNPKTSMWDRIARKLGWDDSIPFGEKAKAMQTAKIQLIDHPIYNHPVYWAPFIVVGR
ncbi:CHAT domain-containing protein [Balneolaceae bacterium YR4-1]|uniref:CHAT domain-containing protein n=1 Tax=Halalkalibaculum roseum TaxID=2709311 RepID=A0A6M1SZU6_9BACT|nr:CHAT domain-containing protein [Halalkalibaculum roseum]